ncbi:hypothetical protein [Nocardia sp. NPDC057227]|uniref:hypothetical protein n=1 Tax=Nocardia sp. NPDC057227 TaxID=3346056 RepID=UPI0036415AF8
MDEARAELLKTVPPFAADGILAGWKAGTAASPPVPAAVAALVGRPALTFAQWVQDHAADFA